LILAVGFRFAFGSAFRIAFGFVFRFAVGSNSPRTLENHY
jgi:hypothetical protein